MNVSEICLLSCPYSYHTVWFQMAAVRVYSQETDKKHIGGNVFLCIYSTNICCYLEPNVISHPCYTAASCQSHQCWQQIKMTPPPPTRPNLYKPVYRTQLLQISVPTPTHWGLHIRCTRWTAGQKNARQICSCARNSRTQLLVRTNTCRCWETKCEVVELLPLGGILDVSVKMGVKISASLINLTWIYITMALLPSNE